MADTIEHIEIGESDSVHRWVEKSSLLADDRANLLSFVRKFPSLLFYRYREVPYDDDHFYAPLPRWLKNISMAFSWVYSEGTAAFQLDNDEGNTYDFSLYSESIDSAYIGLFRSLAKDSLFLIPIAGSLDDPGEVLAVSYRDEEDRKIYSFHAESLADYRRNGFPVKDAISPIYDSYTDMLAHISLIRLQSGDATRDVSALV